MAIVPIFDFRGKTFDHDLLKNVEDSPKINRDLHDGSLAVVAYTANLFSENRPGFNIMWCGLVAEMK